MVSYFEEKLIVVREVLKGHASRNLVCALPKAYRVWIAVAIMLATRDRYLTPNRRVKRPLERIYNELVSLRPDTRLVTTSLDEGLHTSTRHPITGAFRTSLTPPAELLSLLEEVTDRSSLEKFLREVEDQLTKE